MSANTGLAPQTTHRAAATAVSKLDFVRLSSLVTTFAGSTNDPHDCVSGFLDGFSKTAFPADRKPWSLDAPFPREPLSVNAIHGNPYTEPSKLKLSTQLTKKMNYFSYLSTGFTINPRCEIGTNGSGGVDSFSIENLFSDMGSHFLSRSPGTTPAPIQSICQKSLHRLITPTTF